MILAMFVLTGLLVALAAKLWHVRTCHLAERDRRLAVEHYAESLENEIFHVRVIVSAKPGERTSAAVRRALTVFQRATEITKGWRSQGRLS
jgi:hypothetical protein